MTRFKHTPRGLAVPDSRLSRLARLGGLAAGVAGSAALNGSRELLSGKRPQVADLLLTPANASRLTGQLAQMRGAAMKMGQLMSMEADNLLPPELAAILAQLRADAHFMPPTQLKKVLVANWGPDFLKRFKSFDVRPLAAASIGQVHRATTMDGRDLAVKVQYPGVRRSIDADVSNVATLIRMSGLLPRGLDIKPLLQEARRQLHDEADYLREGTMLTRFATLLAGDEGFTVPTLHPDLTTPDILAMSYTPGDAIDTLADAPQALRDDVMTRLITLTLREIFEFRLIQSDPNFANYRYDRNTGKLVLLDFGATRELPATLVDNLRALLGAGLHGTREDMREAAIATGYWEATTAKHHQLRMLDMMELAFAPLRATVPIDFATDTTAARLRAAGMDFARSGDLPVTPPPVEMMFIQRKLAGTYLLASRLKARIDMTRLLAPYR
ncbi:ABC1 kinase family protein [Litoreibacter arenae]|uniref:Ubiquinone biosynthesis monooxygenase UbiB n=1 Tax=Litoreibacter arenae DSM 19593 TaxID=1123360 RepID=S9QLL5_9RHOB|nr:AarF/ABC1/UbiB kinase family protein [Litoreibacter arenae]EPX80622.1 Ubiquinone biosynthesis monooxygenase UbiB [Litoreibacter arenae DSM 19593]